MIHVANLRLTKVPLSSANDNKEFRVSVFMLLKNETSKKGIPFSGTKFYVLI